MPDETPDPRLIDLVVLLVSDDLHNRTLGQFWLAVLALVPDVPHAVLKKISVAWNFSSTMYDLSSNAALVVGSATKRNPRQLAEQIAGWLLQTTRSQR